MTETNTVLARVHTLRQDLNDILLEQEVAIEAALCRRGPEGERRAPQQPPGCQERGDLPQFSIKAIRHKTAEGSPPEAGQ